MKHAIKQLLALLLVLSLVFSLAACTDKPEETGKATVELAVMGVKQEYHRGGVGRALFSAAKQYAVQSGYAFMQVKTVRMGMYEDYDRTNLFYQSLGFQEFEVFPTLWDENNPCQIYVMHLEKNA